MPDSDEARRALRGAVRVEEKRSMQAEPLHTDLGAVETLIGNLQFTFVVNPEGDAHIQIYAADPSSASKPGITLMLDAKGFERLKAIVRNADGLIDRLIREGRIKRMVLPF
jgi:hypothetical protein